MFEMKEVEFSLDSKKEKPRYPFKEGN